MRGRACRETVIEITPFYRHRKMWRRFYFKTKLVKDTEIIEFFQQGLKISCTGKLKITFRNPDKLDITAVADIIVMNSRCRSFFFSFIHEQAG